MGIVRRLAPWRKHLDGKFGTAHGNASLETMNVVTVMLAGFFNPMVRSQRLLEALSAQRWMRKSTGIERIPRSTLSDALKRFDPQQLRPLIGELTRRIPALGRRHKDLALVTRQILAADGTYFNLAGEVAWAIASRRGNTDKPQSRFRLNLQLDTDTFSPVDADISGGDDASEPAALLRRLRGGVIYVLDRNFLHFQLIGAVLDAGSNLVLRLRKNAVFEAQEARELTAKDREHGVVRDEVGHLTGGKTAAHHFTAAAPTQMLRRVTVWDERNGCELLLLTDMLDLPAYVIGALYRERWQIELFFKWLKCYAAFDHAVSKHPGGITLQFYIAVIATLLLHLVTGRPVNKYALFWLGSVAGGQATLEEMFEGLARIEREKALERARLKRKREERKRLAEKTGT